MTPSRFATYLRWQYERAIGAAALAVALACPLSLLPNRILVQSWFYEEFVRGKSFGQFDAWIKAHP